MQAIASESNLSETAFTRQSSPAKFGEGYFTTEEIRMAGHPTIATSFALVETGRFPLSGDHIVLTLEIQVGPIRAHIYAQAGKAQQIVTRQKKPQFLARHDPVEVNPFWGAKPLALFLDTASRAKSQHGHAPIDDSAPRLAKCGTIARHIAEDVEDPFTGSGAGSAFQSQSSAPSKLGRPGLFQVEVVRSRENIETVKVGGREITIIWGEMIL